MWRSNNKKIEKFVNWLNENGALFPDIYFKSMRNGPRGRNEHNKRGIRAKTKISANSEIISIPHKLIIYTDMGGRTKWGQELKNNPQHRLHSPSLINILIYMIQDMKSKPAVFMHYYDILPVNINNFPIFWNENDINYLEKSHLIEEIEQRKQQFKHDYNILITVIPDFEKHCSFQKFNWLRTIIGSRNFGLFIDGKYQAALVPLGDMLNHSLTPDVKWYFDVSQDVFIMSSTRKMGINCEISDSYGVKCNRKYLLYYGFTLDNNKNNRNKVYLQIRDANTDDVLYKERRKLISMNFQCNIDADFNSEEFKRLLYFIRILNANEYELAAFIHSPQLAHKPYNKRNEAAALAFLGLYIYELLQSYPLTLQQNVKNIRTVSTYSNNYFAIRLIIGEKELLKQVLGFTKQGIGLLLYGRRFSLRTVKKGIKIYLQQLKAINHS